MALSIRSNIDSIRAQTQLGRTTAQLSETFERLSSGLRINSGKDDPAGIQLAADLEADARVATVALRNANDGLSLASVADEALGAIGSTLTRMLELATQSANGTYSTSQRSALSSEFLALGSEVDRIAKTTTFNNMYLLSGSSDVTLQVGIDGGATSRILMTAVRGTLESMGLAAGGSSALSFSIISVTSTASQLAATNAMSAVRAAIDSITATRGQVGAAESRLSTAINYLTIMRENYVAAESKIRDIDVAEEVAKMVRLQVLQQAGTAVLAQANQQPQMVLKLLG